MRGHYSHCVSFEVSADAYTRFMGRFSEPLATEFLGLVDPRPGQRVLDVGCGPGALTALLVERYGADDVCAVDPSESFIAAARKAFPGVDVRRAGAEALPFADGSFDAALAELVVQFMTDPVAGLREMGRVTRPDGVVAACVWDHAEGGRGPLSLFWEAVREFDPEQLGETDYAGTGEGQLAELCSAAGLVEPESHTLTVRVGFETFEQWWQPFTLGVGPPGDYVAGLDETARDALRDECASRLPPAPFELAVSAWGVTARRAG